MSQQVIIPVETLKRAAEVLLQHLQEIEGQVISIDRDYYWSIDPEQLYDVLQEPTDLTVGQLAECLDNLNVVIGDPDAALAYGLVWLGDLLRVLGHVVVK